MVAETAVGVEVLVAAVAADSRNTCSESNHQENTMDMQNTSELPDANESERAMKESIKAMAAVIGRCSGESMHWKI